MSLPSRTLTVYNRDLRLHVRVWGELSPTRPVLVLVHGFPDNSLVWSGIAERLAEYCCVVAPDVRGAGGSDAPARIRDYRMEQLVEDLAAVIDTVSPAHPVHLAGHDWGSIQCWEAVSTPRLQGRIASFTSISGPSLDHAAFWMRETFNRHRDDRARVQRVLNQLLHSWYIASFHLPVLPRLTWRMAFNKWPGVSPGNSRSCMPRTFPPRPATGIMASSSTEPTSFPACCIRRAAGPMCRCNWLCPPRTCMSRPACSTIWRAGAQPVAARRRRRTLGPAQSSGSGQRVPARVRPVP